MSFLILRLHLKLEFTFHNKALSRKVVDDQFNCLPITGTVTFVKLIYLSQHIHLLVTCKNKFHSVIPLPAI